MKILLVVNHPTSSLDVIALGTVAAVESHGIETFLLYRNMFLEAIKTCPEIFNRINLVHFLQGVESFPSQTVEILSHYCSIITNYNHCEFQQLPRQFSSVDHLFYISRSLEADLESFGLSNEMMTLIHPGVDTGIFYPQSYQKKSGSFLIGFFGTQPPNSWDRKGSVLLVRATRRMVDLGYRPSFLIVGYGWQKLVADLRNMGLKIFYRINVPFRELPQLYQQLDLYLITSLLEGGPLTLLEAGACGVPIISTPVGLSLEILTQQGCGTLLKGFDSDEIAATVIDEIEHRKQAQKRANFVLTEIRKHWDWKYTYKDIHNTYIEVAKRKQKVNKISISSSHHLMPYLDFEQSAKQQREIAKQYALVDLALRLHSHGDLLAAWRMALPLLSKVHLLYWWRAFQAVTL